MLIYIPNLHLPSCPPLDSFSNFQRGDIYLPSGLQRTKTTDDYIQDTLIYIWDNYIQFVHHLEF